MNMKIETVGNMGSIPEKEHSNLKPVVFTVMALWLGLVSYLGVQGAFVAGGNSPPLGLFLGLAIPLAVFFAAYFGWGEFRAFVLVADLRFVAATQGWRWAGSAAGCRADDLCLRDCGPRSFGCEAARS